MAYLHQTQCAQTFLPSTSSGEYMSGNALATFGVGESRLGAGHEPDALGGLAVGGDLDDRASSWRAG